jgi:hypothetical protein
MVGGGLWVGMSAFADAGALVWTGFARVRLRGTCTQMAATFDLTKRNYGVGNDRVPFGEVSIWG